MVYNSSEILKRLWNASNLFRGFIDIVEYRNYVLNFLFFKYLSDYSRHYRNLDANYESFIEGNENEIYIPENLSFESIYEKRESPNIGQIIKSTLKDIEYHNSSQLYGIFISADYAFFDDPTKKNDILKKFIEEFKNIELGPEHLNPYLLGEVFGQILNRFAVDSGKKGADFYTSLEVCRLVSELIDPQSGETIYDPVAGSGGLLIETAKLIESKKFSLYAQEQNKNAYIICKMNTFMNGMNKNIGGIEWGDVITEPKFLKEEKLMNFDITVASLPWWEKSERHPSDIKDLSRFKWGTPPTGKGDYAFISHIASGMNEENGRAAIIIPHGVLFRGGREKDIRRAMVEDNIIEAVIGLPPNMMYNSSIPVAILILKKNRNRDSILFIDASDEYISDKHSNKLSSENIEKIVGTYRNYETLDKYAYVATKEEVKKNDYQLTIPRYVDTFEEETIDTENVTSKIKDLTRKMEEVRGTLDKYLEEIL
ncbi:type I restriction endonuclease subunit M [Bacillus wiedmannii]|uniref:type I restriction-modification system subunit M n=2 Tax=Bacillus cereus group TaxID=86661 RepID=UPI000BF5AC55|nr:type I restriction-modification system subunit M [Bacillus wiedmannii]PGC12749.1 type I restriction endonuclease subunit M [Bacillus wiedmannii]